jgi:hypothetical protein
MRNDPKANCRHSRSKSLVNVLILVLLLGACAAPPINKLVQTQTPPPGATRAAPASTLNPGPSSATPAPTATPAEETMPATSDKPGLSLEESLRINPPPPAGLKVIRTAEGVALSWDPPPPVTVPHSYSDTVSYYKVYRRMDGSQFAYLAQTTQLLYLDRSAQTGIKYYYTITAMLDDSNESLRPNEVAVP